MHINILGTRGIPAAHGGFETFAARLAPYLVEHGHEVLVYCQPEEGPKRVWVEDQWHGIRRRHFRPKFDGAAGTMEFDMAVALDVLNNPGVDLVLGYNTAVFNVIERLKRRRILMNMDGIEWKRDKWGIFAKVWFYFNEIIGANLCHVPIADHPEIASHVADRCFKKPVMIPYGADRIDYAEPALVEALGLQPDNYFISIARIEPENSILELVQAFTTLETTAKCIVLGKLDPNNRYHDAVRKAAGPNVMFPGAIYDQDVVAALRFHARAYLHGHQVGGTNPSLVEALGAGNAVIAHDNRFNRWTAGTDQLFFNNLSECRSQMHKFLTDLPRVHQARQAARKRHADSFTWDEVLTAYEKIIVTK